MGAAVRSSINSRQCFGRVRHVVYVVTTPKGLVVNGTGPRTWSHADYLRANTYTDSVR